MPQQTALTIAEQNLNDVWNEHLRAEFSSHSADQTIVTMSANPLLLAPARLREIDLVLVAMLASES